MTLLQHVALGIARRLHGRMMVVEGSILYAAPSRQHRDAIGRCRHRIVAEAQRLQLKLEVPVGEGMVPNVLHTMPRRGEICRSVRP